MRVPIIGDKVGEQTKEAVIHNLIKIDAIACGVEARYELITNHSRRATEETVRIARKLGLPEDTIKKWLVHRSTGDTNSVNRIKALINRKGL